MRARKIQVFLYGSYMSLPILKAAGLSKRAFAPASLAGFELTIAPHANLVDAGDGIVYGIVANFTHAELHQLYAVHGPTVFGADYHPEPVMVRTRGGKNVPAITYIAAQTEGGPPDATYHETILKAVKDYGFPKWYINHVESMKG